MEYCGGVSVSIGRDEKLDIDPGVSRLSAEDVVRFCIR